MYIFPETAKEIFERELWSNPEKIYVLVKEYPFLKRGRKDCFMMLPLETP